MTFPQENAAPERNFKHRLVYGNRGMFTQEKKTHFENQFSSSYLIVWTRNESMKVLKICRCVQSIKNYDGKSTSCTIYLKNNQVTPPLTFTSQGLCRRGPTGSRWDPPSPNPFSSSQEGRGEGPQGKTNSPQGSSNICLGSIVTLSTRSKKTLNTISKMTSSKVPFLLL